MLDASFAAKLLDLSGKVVVITGINGGLGTVIADAFAACGAQVAGIDRDAPASAKYETVAANVASAADVAAAFAKLERSVGSPDVLINNAGVREVKTILDLEPAEWDAVVGVNLNGVYYCSREAALRMKKSGRGGSIINTASVAGMLGITHRPAYVSTKHAIIGLTKNLSIDLAPYGIRVNAVSPGTVRTPLTEAYYADPQFLADFEATVPLGAKGTPQDVANAFLFLASPMAAYVTGVVLPIDGGWTSSKSYSYGGSNAYTNAASGTS
jgi:NAD(P)-dependent dehydrogenase (short-subunit alcohol dehydrogenase family)